MLEWNVFYDDFNHRRIEKYNIFNHYSFHDDCKKAAKKFKDNKEAFAEEVYRRLKYFFWAKCEWEIILSDWPPHDDFHCEKVDVFKQVALNWDIFIDWLWENKEKL